MFAGDSGRGQRRGWSRDAQHSGHTPDAVPESDHCERTDVLRPRRLQQ